jgi:hypothetical protein
VLKESSESPPQRFCGGRRGGRELTRSAARPSDPVSATKMAWADPSRRSKLSCRPSGEKRGFHSFWSGVDVTFRGTSCGVSIAKAFERIAAAAGETGSCGPGTGSEEPGVEAATTRDETATAVPPRSARRWIIQLP